MRELLCCVLVFVSLTAAPALAQTPALAPVPAPSDAFPIEIVKNYQDIEVMEDGSYVHGAETTYKILNQQGLSDLQQMAFSFTQGYQNLQIVTVYTLKANGTRIDVPEGRMLFSHGATSLPGFQDETTVQVFFPNVEIGDQVVIRTLRTQKMRHSAELPNIQTCR